MFSSLTLMRLATVGPLLTAGRRIVESPKRRPPCEETTSLCNVEASLGLRHCSGFDEGSYETYEGAYICMSHTLVCGKQKYGLGRCRPRCPSKIRRPESRLCSREGDIWIFDAGECGGRLGCENEMNGRRGDVIASGRRHSTSPPPGTPWCAQRAARCVDAALRGLIVVPIAFRDGEVTTPLRTNV